MLRVIWRQSTGRAQALRAGTPLFRDIALVGGAEPVFSVPTVTLARRRQALPAALREDPVIDLAAYQHAFAPTRESAEQLVTRLRNEPGVTWAAIQPRPEPAFFLDESRRSGVVRKVPLSLRAFALTGATPDLRQWQTHLDPAPDGIGARAARAVPGATGARIRIADVESGWNFCHEDLTQLQTGVVFGVNQPDRDHGTAVLGIIGGDANGYGIEGIVPDAVCSGYSATYEWSHGKWNAADAIRAAADRLTPGDVILLEMHAPGPNSQERDWSQGYVPIEFWESEFAAIRYAVARGIHVVEAAGNGGETLDAPEYLGAFARDTRDSGAILVGGGASPLQQDPRSRIWWSNYGSRLDAQGWGEDIVTTGGRSAAHYCDLWSDDDESRCYTQSFGGTSGASPIVVGAVAAIEGALRAAGHGSLSPAEMRELLASTGTQQANGPDGDVSHRIGRLPDMQEAMRALAL